MSSFKEYALQYFNKGLMPLPIKPNNKSPIAFEWNSIEITEEVILDWINKYPNAGIGLLMGKKSNLVGVDIDTDDKEVLDKAPYSPIVKRGARGETRFFIYNGELTSARKPIDILSCGKSCVLPPSIHPDTKAPYFWLTENTLLNFNLDLLPVIPKEYLESLKVTASNDIGRHNTLKSHAFAKISDNKDLVTIVKELIDYDKQVHSKPYFSDKSEGHKGFEQSSATNMVASCMKTLSSKGVEYDVLDISEVVFSQQNIESVLQIKTEWKKLPKLEGVGKDIFNDIYNLSPTPRAQFAFMATISLISTCIGNKLFLKGTGANLYLYSLGGSGTGKDFPMKRIQHYIIKAEMDNLLGTNSPTSESLVMKVMSMNRESIFFINEAESLLKRMSNDSTNNGVKECLTSIFESSGKSVLPKKILKQTSKGVDIDIIGKVFSPYLNLYLSSTIEAFKEHGRKSMFSTGFGARFLYFFEDRRKRSKVLDTYSPSVDPKIVDILNVIKSHGSYIDIDPNAEINISEALLKEDAKKELNNYLEIIQDEIYKSNDLSFVEVISRKPMYLNKFALIHHVMMNPENYIYTHVEKESVRWAFKAIDAIYHNMIINLKEYVTCSDYEKKYNEMVSYVRKRTEKKIGTPRKDLAARFNYGSTLRSSILKDILESETFYIDTEKKIWFNSKKTENLS